MTANEEAAIISQLFCFMRPILNLNVTDIVGAGETKIETAQEKTFNYEPSTGPR